MRLHLVSAVLYVVLICGSSGAPQRGRADGQSLLPLGALFSQIHDIRNMQRQAIRPIIHPFSRLAHRQRPAENQATNDAIEDEDIPEEPQDNKRNQGRPNTKPEPTNRRNRPNQNEGQVADTELNPRNENRNAQRRKQNKPNRTKSTTQMPDEELNLREQDENNLPTSGNQGSTTIATFTGLKNPGALPPLPSFNNQPGASGGLLEPPGNMSPIKSDLPKAPELLSRPSSGLLSPPAGLPSSPTGLPPKFAGLPSPPAGLPPQPSGLPPSPAGISPLQKGLPPSPAHAGTTEDWGDVTHGDDEAVEHITRRIIGAPCLGGTAQDGSCRGGFD